MTINILNGDCSEVLKTLETNSVDAFVTDPPYGIGKIYEGKKEKASTPEQYWEWLGPIYNEGMRCLKPGGFFAIWQSCQYMRYFWDWFGNDIRIYCAAKNFTQLRKIPINYGYDPVVMFYKTGAEPLRPEKPRRNIDYFVANTAAMVSDTSRPERQHPYPRPIDQVREIIQNFVVPGGVVLDPFVGSGTTAIACVLEARSCIGIEIEPKYLEIINTRLLSLQKDSSLYGDF